MKSIITLLSIFALTSSISTNASELEVSKITMQDLENKIPSLKNTWNNKLSFPNGTIIYKQSNLFDLDTVQFRDVYQQEVTSLKTGNTLLDSNQTLNKEGFLTNKIRLMSGVAPISLHDNQPIMLCRLENHVQDTYYEMSVTQYKTYQKAFPNNYSMAHLCTRDGFARSYWKFRLSNYYDYYGNKK